MIFQIILHTYHIKREKYFVVLKFTHEKNDFVEVSKNLAR